MPAELTFEQLKERLHKCNPHLTILDKPVKSTDKIRVHCDVCSATYITTKYNLRHNINGNRNSCPVCASRLIVKGINDFATSAPYLVQYFVNNEDAYTHGKTSNKKVETECPICHNRKFMEIGKMYARGFTCSVCGDTISYPNKFARGLLQQLPTENWICEYHTDWLDKKSFDNYFEFKGKKYVLEMDGRQHFENILMKNGKNVFLRNEKENDSLKDKLAKEHDITVIRIDSRDSDRYFIQKNIEKSLMSELFDLSKVDWNKCAEYASKNIVKDVSDYYNNVSDSTKIIAEHFNLNMSTVVVYLKQGASFGLCDFSYELARKKIGQKNKRTLRDKFGIPINAYDENHNFIGTYKSYGDCADELNRIYPEKNFLGRSIGTMLCQHNGETYYKGFYFETIKEKKKCRLSIEIIMEMKFLLVV